MPWFLSSCIPIIAILLLAHDARAQEHPGWPERGLVDEVSRLVGQTVEPQSAEQAPSTLLLDPTEELSCFIGPDDKMTYAQAGEASSLFLVSKGGRVHTIQFYYPVVTVSGNESAPGFFQGIFGYLFPEWDKAEEWPIESLIDSWDATGRAMVDPTVSANETISRNSVSGARLATAGVPPDVVWYRVTTRSGCEKVSPYLLASPREPIKDEAQRNAHQTKAQMLLNYAHPIPVDVSATPFFLGSTSSRSDAGTTIVFETPQVLVELDDWIDRQARSTRYSSTTAAVEEFWGYQSFYLYLITDPAVAVKIEGKPATAIIEKMNSWVRKTATGGLQVSPFDVKAVFFAATPPTDRPPEPNTDYYVGSNIVVYRKRPDPVDVSATPIHLGRMHLYNPGQSGDQPGYYAIESSGLGIAIKDRASGQEMRLDLTKWAAANGMLEASRGGHLMTDPVVHFQFLGKPHALVLEGIEIERDGGGKVTWMTGHVFTAR